MIIPETGQTLYIGRISKKLLDFVEKVFDNRECFLYNSKCTIMDWRELCC